MKSSDRHEESGGGPGLPAGIKDGNARGTTLAPIVEAGPFCEWGLCRAPLSGPPRPACGSPYQHNTSKGEPARREPVPYYDPVTMRCPHGTRHPHECRDGCEEGEPSRASSLWGVAAEMQGEPTPREPISPTDESTPHQREFTALRNAGFVGVAPPAPTDGAELARLPALGDLLPALPEEIRRALIGGDPTRWRLALACKLLLGERERMAADKEEIFEDTGAMLAERRVEIETLRARVAELEAEREKLTAEKDRWKAATHKLASEAVDAEALAVALEKDRTRLRACAEEAERKLADVAAFQTSTAAGVVAEAQPLALPLPGDAPVNPKPATWDDGGSR